MGVPPVAAIPACQTLGPSSAQLPALPDRLQVAIRLVNNLVKPLLYHSLPIPSESTPPYCSTAYTNYRPHQQLVGQCKYLHVCDSRVFSRMSQLQ